MASLADIFARADALIAEDSVTATQPMPTTEPTAAPVTEPVTASLSDALGETVEDEYLKSHPLKDAAQWLDEPDEPPRPLIENLIERGSCVAIVGPAKSAKTWLEIETAVCLAAGRDWFGRKTTPQIVYVANIEVSSRQYKKRLRSICTHLGVDRSELHGRLFVDNLRGERATFESCLARAKAARAEVVIVDPFYQVFRGSEKDDAQCQEAIEEMKKFLKLGMTLVMVFHAPKGLSGDRQIVDMISGSSVLVRFPENVIAILPHATDPNARVIDCSVLRDYAPPDPFTVKLADGALVLAPEVTPELKSGNRYSPRKSQSEIDAEKVRRRNDAMAGMKDVATEFITECGTKIPNSTQLSDTLKSKYPRPLVEDFLKSIKAGVIDGLASVREMWRNPKTGKVGERPSRSGGVVFITTTEKARAYAEQYNLLSLE